MRGKQMPLNHSQNPRKMKSQIVDSYKHFVGMNASHLVWEVRGTDDRFSFLI